MRAWLSLAAFGGLRCGEIAGIDREDVLDHHEPPLLIVRKGKGRKERAVPLHPDVLESLRRYRMPTSGPIFRYGPQAATTGYKVSQQGNAYLRNFGLTHRMHSLRHFFASRLYATTRDLRLVQEMLGHSSPQTTAIYAAFNPGDAVDAVCALAVRT